MPTFTEEATAKIHAASDALIAANGPLASAREALAATQTDIAAYSASVGPLFDQALSHEQDGQLASAQFALTEFHAVPHVAEDKYQQLFDTFVSRGYRLHSFTGHEFEHVRPESQDARTYFNVIFSKGESNSAFCTVHGMDPDAYADLLGKYGAEGYRLARTTVFMTGDRVRYTPILVQDGVTDCPTYQGATPEAHATARQELEAAGYRLTTLAGVFPGGVEQVTAIYGKSDAKPYYAEGNMTLERFSTLGRDHGGDGATLSDVQVADCNGEPRFYAVWSAIDPRECVMSCNMDGDAWRSEHLLWVGEGYNVEVLASYTWNGEPNYVAVWKKGPGDVGLVQPNGPPIPPEVDLPPMPHFP